MQYAILENIMRLIGIGGSTASGKTVLAEQLITHFEASTNRFSKILEAKADEYGYTKDKAGLQALSTMLRSTQGEDILAREMSAWILGHSNDTLVVEGMRRDIDVATLEKTAKEAGREWTFFFVDAPLETRFLRFNGRLIKQGLLPVSHEEFATLESQESEAELPHLRARAHCVIHNEEKSIDELTAEALAHIL